jgi:hypothetical protein
MVWLISFLTVSNITLGYGLAVYIQRQFGTPLPAGISWRRKKAEAISPVEAVAPTVGAQVPVASEAIPTQTAKPQSAKPSETKAAEVNPAPQMSTPTAIPAEETSALPPVDEENVLAGIEEFRSQLAKMNVSAKESAEAPDVAATAEELAAAN